MSAHVLNRVREQLDWLRGSGIQQPPGSEENGGVHAWMEHVPDRTPTAAYLYSEITGYFMTLCWQLTHGLGATVARSHNLNIGSDWTDRARRAATWIVSRAQHPSGAILPRKYLDVAQGSRDPFSFEHGRSLFFDCAIVGYGLVLTHRMTEDARWLDAAQRIARFMLRAFESSDSKACCAVYDLTNDRPIPPEPRWSVHFGPFETKGVMFFDELARKSPADAPQLRARIDALLQGALTAQAPDGRFPTHPEGHTTHLHPHCYAIEGLLYLASRARPDLLPPAARAIAWMFETCLLTERPMQQWSERSELRVYGVRSDALAQALRARRLLHLLCPDIRFDWDAEAGRLWGLLDKHALPGGGTGYGQDETGEKPRHANAWCQFFALEANLLRLLDTLPKDSELVIT